MDVAALVHELIARETLTGVTLSKPRRSDPARASKITVDPVLVDRELRYRWRRHTATRTTDENLGAEETERRLVHLIGGDFRQALLRGTDADHQVLAGGTGATTRMPASRPRPSYASNRAKRRLLEEGTPVPFLVELGVMTPEGRVKAPRYPKFRQINRFAELVDDVLQTFPRGHFGSSTLDPASRTSRSRSTTCSPSSAGRDVDLIGLDLKEDVVSTCEALAAPARREWASLRSRRHRRVRGRFGRSGGLAPRLRHRNRRGDRARRPLGGTGDPRRPLLSARAAPQLENAALTPFSPGVSARALRRRCDRRGSCAAPRGGRLRRSGGRVRPARAHGEERPHPRRTSARVAIAPRHFARISI